MSNVKPFKDLSEQLFGKRGSLLTLWGEIARNFYLERDDFDSARNIGAEMTKGTMTSYPIIARRQLGDAFGAML